jgi:predicted DNA-binding transcriptional regulator YafY
MGKFKPQFSRLAFIDRRIGEGSYPNSSTLAREYEVSSRTILRDIEYLRDMLDAPIGYDRSRRGYYYTEPHYHLPTINIGESDLFAICIAEKALEQYANTPLYGKLSSVFDKLRLFLPDSVSVSTSWIDTHYTFLRESHTMLDPEIWETVSLALRRRKRVRITHQKAGSGSPIKRLVDPYHIVNYRGEWYLIGLCHLRYAVQRFALSRIRSADMTDQDYEVSEGFDFDAFMGSYFGIMTEEREYTVRIEFSPSQAPYIRERIWHPVQEIEDKRNGSVVLSFPTNSLFEVKRWVLSWGADAVVLSPKILSDQVRDELVQAAARYR